MDSLKKESGSKKPVAGRNPELAICCKFDFGSPLTSKALQAGSSRSPERLEIRILFIFQLAWRRIQCVSLEPIRVKLSASQCPETATGHLLAAMTLQILTLVVQIFHVCFGKVAVLKCQVKNRLTTENNILFQ